MLNASLPNTSPTSQFSSHPPFNLSLFLESMLICAVLQGDADFFLLPFFIWEDKRQKWEKIEEKCTFFFSYYIFCKPHLAIKQDKPRKKQHSKWWINQEGATTLSSTSDSLRMKKNKGWVSSRTRAHYQQTYTFCFHNLHRWALSFHKNDWQITLFRPQIWYLSFPLADGLWYSFEERRS